MTEIVSTVVDSQAFEYNLYSESINIDEFESQLIETSLENSCGSPHAAYPGNIVGENVAEIAKKVKKPMSAWLLYSTEYREKVHREQPQLNFKEIAQTLSENYKKLSPELRQHYEELAMKDKLRYQQETLLNMSRIPATLPSAEAKDLIFPLVRMFVGV